jgi:lysophospholipase L1-like esterase
MKTRPTAIIAFVLFTLVIAQGLLAANEIPKHIATTPAVQDMSWAQSWWMPRHEAKLKEAQAAADKIKLIFIGDSITHFWEDRGRKVWDKYYAPRGALNLGFSGDRTEQLLWRIDHGTFGGLNPKLLVMLIGVNNIGHGRSNPVQTIDGIKAIVDRIEKKLPETKILLLAVFPWGEKPDNPRRAQIVEINQGISKLADNKKLFYLDIGQKFLNADGTMPKSIMPDFLHPGLQGYQIWAEAIEPTVSRLMGEK